MDVIVEITKILDVQTFTSKSDSTRVINKYSFVGRTQDQFPKTICFNCINDESWTKWGIKQGGVYQVSFDVRSREWNGRWFTECNVWRIQNTTNTIPQPQPQVLQQPQESQATDNQLPF